MSLCLLRFYSIKVKVYVLKEYAPDFIDLSSKLDRCLFKTSTFFKLVRLIEYESLFHLPNYI